MVRILFLLSWRLKIRMISYLLRLLRVTLNVHLPCFSFEITHLTVILAFYLAPHYLLTCSTVTLDPRAQQWSHNLFVLLKDTIMGIFSTRQKRISALACTKDSQWFSSHFDLLIDVLFNKIFWIFFSVSGFVPQNLNISGIKSRLTNINWLESCLRLL